MIGFKPPLRSGRISLVPQDLTPDSGRSSVVFLPPDYSIFPAFFSFLFLKEVSRTPQDELTAMNTVSLKGPNPTMNSYVDFPH